MKNGRKLGEEWTVTQTQLSKTKTGHRLGQPESHLRPQNFSCRRNFEFHHWRKKILDRLVRQVTWQLLLQLGSKKNLWHPWVVALILLGLHLLSIFAWTEFLSRGKKESKCSGAVAQSVERPSKGLRLVQLYWRGFKSRSLHKVEGKNSRNGPPDPMIYDLDSIKWLLHFASCILMGYLTRPAYTACFMLKWVKHHWGVSNHKSIFN